MLLHCIGEYLLLRAGFTFSKLKDAGIPFPRKLGVVEKLVIELNLDKQWFYALSYLTDPEYFLMVINQIKYLWFLDTAQQMRDKEAIADLFEIVNDSCIQYLQKEEHKRMYADIRSRVRGKCEKLFEHLSDKDGKKDKLTQLWKDEQNKTAQSLSATLTKCYLRFKTVLEEHWEESKGYPANKGNDSSMRFSVEPEGCQIVLEEVESLTQHAPHLVPILREEIFQVKSASTPGRSKLLTDLTSSTIPPFQLPDSAKRSRKVDLAAGPEIGTAEIVSARYPSSSSSSKKSEELVSSSQSDSLFGEENPEPPSKASAEANLAMEKSNNELVLRVTELVKLVGELLKSRGGQDAKDKDPVAEPSAPLLPLCVRSLRNSLEEPLPETLETVSSTTSHRLNILLEDMDLLDAEEMNTVTKDCGKIVENEQDAKTASDMDREERVHDKDIVRKNVSPAEKEPESSKPSLNSKPKKLSGEKPPERSVIRTRSKRRMKDDVHAILQTATVNVITIPDSGTAVPEPSEPKVDDQDRRTKRVKRPRDQSQGESAELKETNSRKKTKASRCRPRKGSKHKVVHSKSTKPVEDEELFPSQLVPLDQPVSSTAPLAFDKQPKDPVIRLKNMKKKWCASRTHQNKGADDEVTSSTTSTAPSGAAGKDKQTKSGKVDKSTQAQTKGKVHVKSGAPSFTATDISKSTKKDKLDEPDDVFVDKISPLTFVENPSLLPPSIERTSETKPKRQPRCPTRQPRRTMTRRAAETTVLVDVSEDEDSLPDLSLDLRDGQGGGPDNSDISLIPV